MLVTGNIELTIEDVKQALTLPLPGQAGQIKMAPLPPRELHADRWIIPDDCREAGVLLLLYPHILGNGNNELHIALIRRPEYPGTHGGQVSFPGGQREFGETLKETAIRETREEIGVRPETVHVLGRLSKLYTPPSNYCIYPFVAFASSRPEFRLDVIEVAELIEVPLQLLLDPSTQKREVWHFENFGERDVPFFDVFGHKVWGATAMILSEFLTLLQPTEG